MMSLRFVEPRTDGSHLARLWAGLPLVCLLSLPPLVLVEVRSVPMARLPQLVFQPPDPSDPRIRHSSAIAPPDSWLTGATSLRPLAVCPWYC